MDIYISYRRSSAIEMARSLSGRLRELEYYSFFDIESIHEGDFPLHIFENIRRSMNFLLILTPGALDRCNDDDWVRKELAEAFRLDKNIIPVICQGFSFPEELPDDIARIRNIQAILYNSLDFEDLVEKTISRLKDSEGKALRLSKSRNRSNTFYEDIPMSAEEKERIASDYEACQSIEKPVFDELLSGKKDVVLFNPAIYEIDSYMRKYTRPEISRVFGLLNSQQDAVDANERYGSNGHQRNAFYKGNMEHGSFGDEMDLILSENGIRHFDFADLTLILRDSSDPEAKLREVVERMDSGGIVYVRELDHGMALAYPDDQGLFRQMLSYIRRDDYSGDYEAGRKVYLWMRNADLTGIRFAGRQLSTVGMKRKEKRNLFNALFSYVEREYRAMHEMEETVETARAIEWLEENYKSLETQFSSDDFFFSTGFMVFYGFVE